MSYHLQPSQRNDRLMDSLQKFNVPPYCLRRGSACFDKISMLVYALDLPLFTDFSASNQMSRSFPWTHPFFFQSFLAFFWIRQFSSELKNSLTGVVCHKPLEPVFFPIAFPPLFCQSQLWRDTSWERVIMDFDVFWDNGVKPYVKNVAQKKLVLIRGSPNSEAIHYSEK